MALQSRIPEIVDAIEAETHRALLRGAHLIADDAVVRLNIVDPDPDEVLAKAIHVEEDGDGDGVYVVAGNNRDAFYGIWVEHGTTHSAPRPFLVPALEENRAPVEAMVAEAIRKAVS